jgi:hypothetical protein
LLQRKAFSGSLDAALEVADNLDSLMSGSLQENSDIKFLIAIS